MVLKNEGETLFLLQAMEAGGLVEFVQVPHSVLRVCIFGLKFWKEKTTGSWQGTFVALPSQNSIGVSRVDV